MCKFKVGDKVKRKNSNSFSNGEQVLTVEGFYYDALYNEYAARFKETGTHLTESKLDLVFTKSDLKDGMVVSYRDSFCGTDDVKRIVFKGSLYRVSEDSLSMSHGVYLKYYSDTLEYDNDVDMDIIKVEYMGEVLWERKEEPKKVKLELEVTPEQAEMIKKQLGV